MDRPSQSFGGPWTQQKLEVLRKYLDAYTTALKKQSFDLLYLDAFAGTGYRTLAQQVHATFEPFVERQAEAFLDGSARIALEVKDKPFDRLIFIEQSRQKCVELEKLKAQHPGRGIEIIQGDANQALVQWCDRQNWKTQRAVLFLDPFATQVEWATIDTVARTRAIDTWILFPVGAVGRMLPGSRRPEEIDQTWRNRLDTIFGTGQWTKAFYRPSVETGLFGEQAHQKRIATAEVILDYFIERLRTTFASVADHYALLKNSRGAALFGLCFAAANEKGAPIARRIAEHILKGM